MLMITGMLVRQACMLICQVLVCHFRFVFIINVRDLFFWKIVYGLADVPHLLWNDIVNTVCYSFSASHSSRRHCCCTCSGSSSCGRTSCSCRSSSCSSVVWCLCC
uniref:Uncharacterized protein n=2 Tax=Cacopsylla melanoneura TaxID=428564 RepID=A0A8D8QRG9_9HEMI